MEKNDILKGLKERILSDLEKGVFTPWQDPNIVSCRAFNPVTKKAYKGKNMAALGYVMDEKESNDPRFMTFPQIVKAGYRLKKGSHGYPVELWKTIGTPVEKTDADQSGMDNLFKSDEKITEWKNVHPVHVRNYTVFHASDIIGIPEWKEENGGYSDDEKNAAMESMIKNSQAPILFDGKAEKHGANFYSVVFDEIHLMRRSSFISTAEFYGTAAHEIAHSTGYVERLNRKFVSKKGNDDYAREELVAEFTSAMIRAEFGGAVSVDHLKNQKEYIKSWLKQLKDKPETLDKAIADAQKAFEYIKKNMIFKDKAVKAAYEKKIKELPDIPQDDDKMKSKKTEKAAAKGTRYEITISKKRKSAKKFVITVKK